MSAENKPVVLPVGGFDILRLAHPQIEDLNEDFLCGLCKSNLLSIFI
jgi:hypothetical protein